MIRDEIRNIKSGTKELRQFGWISAVFLLVLGCLSLWKGKHISFYLLGASFLFFVGGLLVPAFLKPLHKAWMTLAVIMGWIMSRIILIFLFIVVLTPTALITRLFGKEYLVRKIDKNEKSYWNIRSRLSKEAREYEKQF